MDRARVERYRVDAGKSKGADAVRGVPDAAALGERAHAQKTHVVQHHIEVLLGGDPLEIRDLRGNRVDEELDQVEPQLREALVQSAARKLAAELGIIVVAGVLHRDEARAAALYRALVLATGVPPHFMPPGHERATDTPIADILSCVSHVMESSARFDAASSSRRFTIGAPDAVSAVILPRLVSDLRRSAPRIDIRVRHVFPQHSLEELESRAVDLVITPLEDIPKRFASRVIAEEDFVIAARTGHPFFRRPTLENYCEQQHILASASGDPKGFVDIELERLGRSRRIAVIIPHIMMALTALTDTDLIAALPRSLVKAQGPRFELSSVAAPLTLPVSPLRAVVPRKSASATPCSATMLACPSTSLRCRRSAP